MRPASGITPTGLFTPEAFDPVAWGKRSATPGTRRADSRTLKAFHNRREVVQPFQGKKNDNATWGAPLRGDPRLWDQTPAAYFLRPDSRQLSNARLISPLSLNA
jgi:hypothetical protein